MRIVDTRSEASTSLEAIKERKIEMDIPVDDLTPDHILSIVQAFAEQEQRHLPRRKALRGGRAADLERDKSQISLFEAGGEADAGSS